MSCIRHPLATVAAFPLIAAVVLAACDFGPAAPTPEPKGGAGEFRVILTGEPQSLNPNLRVDDPAFNVAQNLYNKLVTLDADYHIIPDLAEKWTVSDDGLTYTFHLVQGVKWHDGQPCTSADVKWTFEALAREKCVVQETARLLVDIQTPDAATVVMRLKEPWSPFISTIAWYGAFILPKHVYDGRDWTQNPANEAPVGTGPFRFVEWVKGDHITLAAHPGYFRRGPYLDRLTYRVVKDPSAAMVELLLKGEVEYSLARPAFERIPDLLRAPGLKVQTFPQPSRYYIGFNLRRQPWDDQRVRQAVNMAINRPALVERAMLGYGAPGLGFYTPAVPWAYNPTAQVPAFDAAGAARLLAQAGLTPGADGARHHLTLVTHVASPFKELAQAVQAQLRDVGLMAEVVLLPAADYTQRVSQEHNFDLALTDGTWGPDPNNLYLRFSSQGANQFMGYASAEFDAAVIEGARQTRLEDRIQAYFRAQEILARDLPLAPLTEHVQILVYPDTVTGLPQVEARGLVTFQDYSLVRVRR